MLAKRRIRATPKMGDRVCPACNGTKEQQVCDDGLYEWINCETCAGHGWLPAGPDTGDEIDEPLPLFAV